LFCIKVSISKLLPIAITKKLKEDKRKLKREKQILKKQQIKFNFFKIKNQHSLIMSISSP